MLACFYCAGVVATSPPDPRFATYKGAGMIFTDGSVVLCGWEPRKRKPGLYGIGGKAENSVDHRDYRHTAAREVLEELFGVVPATTLVEAVAREFCGDVDRTSMVDGYVMIRCSFRDLQQLLRRVAAARLKSPMYPERVPRSLEELLFARHSVAATEMAQLCLLPVAQRMPRISSDLGDDIIRIWAADHPLECEKKTSK